MATNLTQDFAKAREQYFTTRQENEIDLVHTVRSMLVESRVSMAQLVAYDNDRNLQVAGQRNSAVQRFVLNRFWTTQLYIVPDDTEELRRLLFPDGEIQTWLDSFKQKILPFIVAHSLPVSL